ncbi:sensor histidine kinase [Emticicia sp. SJ17W-69]|uniref:sensor histidine kinase n=1 Tax=Emticicia sp. SJ17W-69 TaxID=3421657 RepID=UPI003EB86501
MNNTFFHLLQAGIFLMMLLYCFVSYIVYQYKLYLSIFVHTGSLFLAYFAFSSKQSLVEILSFFAYLAYINSVVFYIQHHTFLKINHLSLLLAQFIAGCGSIFYLLNYQTSFIPIFGLIARYLIMSGLIIYFIQLTKTTEKYKSLWMSLLFCILALCFYILINIYNHYIMTLDTKEWDIIIFKTITIFQIFFLINGLIGKLYSFTTEKEELESLFFQQMQENFLYHLRLKQIKEDINSNLHDDIGSQLSVINSLNQLALQWLDKEPKKAIKYVNDMKKALDTIPYKIENIITNNEAEDINENKPIFINEMPAILFEPMDVKYTININNEKDWEQINDSIKKHFFLIYKEILVNIVRHSKASMVIIDISLKNNNISLTIRDNGIGFDTNKKVDGHGLYSIRRRVANLKGRLSVVSSIGNGCRLTIII